MVRLKHTNLKKSVMFDHKERDDTIIALHSEMIKFGASFWWGQVWGRSSERVVIPTGSEFLKTKHPIPKMTPFLRWTSVRHFLRFADFLQLKSLSTPTYLQRQRSSTSFSMTFPPFPQIHCGLGKIWEIKSSGGSVPAKSRHPPPTPPFAKFWVQSKAKQDLDIPGS